MMIHCRQSSTAAKRTSLLRVLVALVSAGLVPATQGCASKVDSLIGRLEHRDPVERSVAAWELGRMGPEGAKAVPSLIDALDDPDDAVCCSAAQALGNMGAAAAPAVPALRRALRRKPRGSFLLRRSYEWKAAMSGTDFVAAGNTALKKIRQAQATTQPAAERSE